MAKKISLLIFAVMLSYGSLLWSQADIVVQKISIDPEKPVPGGVVKISAVITNPTFYDFKGKVKIAFILDDKTIFEQEEESIASQSVKTYQTETTPAEGDHVLKVTVDPGSEMEMNAVNNIEELNFSVLTEKDRIARESEAEKKDLPDLVCEEMIRPARADMIPDNIVIFYAVFTLYGKEKIPGPFAAEWIVNEKTLAKINVKNFPPDIKWKFGMKWAAKVGRHDLKAAIDSENIIKEKDDTNNTCELTFSVHPKTPEYEDRAPDGRVRRLSYQKDLEAITGEPVYIEEVLIEPVSEEGTSTESRITYVVHNISGRDYRNIQITASLPGKFIHSFFIDRLQPDERYKMSFIEKIRDGKINFNIALEESEFEQQGFFVPEEEKK
jgi:hypothetical protein